MSTSSMTLKSIAAAATVGIVVACGAAPESGVSSIDADEPTGSQTPSTADDSVPWGQLLDGDRTERTHSGPTTGCVTIDTMLPC